MERTILRNRSFFCISGDGGVGRTKVQKKTEGSIRPPVSIRSCALQLFLAMLFLRAVSAVLGLLLGTVLALLGLLGAVLVIAFATVASLVLSVLGAVGAVSRAFSLFHLYGFGSLLLGILVGVATTADKSYGCQNDDE